MEAQQTNQGSGKIELEGGWIDISQPLSSDLAHWPGDTPFSFQLSYTKEQTGSVNIGRMTTSLHSGTHIDAPFHFDHAGVRVHELDLNLYIGLCRVIDVTSSVAIDRAALSQHNLQGISRVLLRTNVPNNPNRFPEKIPYITRDGASFLAEQGIKLIGVDVPSVDPLDSKELEGHHSLHQHGIHILENVMLDHVELGDYYLIAVPLNIIGADGSPVRAVIKPLK